jgi:hypothetical protein
MQISRHGECLLRSTSSINSMCRKISTKSLQDFSIDVDTTKVIMTLMRNYAIILGSIRHTPYSCQDSAMHSRRIVISARDAVSPCCRWEVMISHVQRLETLVENLGCHLSET